MPVQQQSMSCDLELLRYTHANKCQQQTVFDTVMANDGMIHMTLAARSWVPSNLTYYVFVQRICRTAQYNTTTYRSGFESVICSIQCYMGVLTFFLYVFRC